MNTTLQLANKGSLITLADSNQCLGYLMFFEGRGTYDASYGAVNVTKDEADTHNKLLDEAMLKGLDENCQVGQWGAFYFNPNTRKVITFMGTRVDEIVSYVPGRKVVTFIRKGHQFRGMIQKEADCVNFKRIS